MLKKFLNFLLSHRFYILFHSRLSFKAAANVQAFFN